MLYGLPSHTIIAVKLGNVWPSVYFVPVPDFRKSTSASLQVPPRNARPSVSEDVCDIAQHECRRVNFASVTFKCRQPEKMKLLAGSMRHRSIASPLHTRGFSNWSELLPAIREQHGRLDT
jgi:hypothetical protein